MHSGEEQTGLYSYPSSPPLFIAFFFPLSLSASFSFFSRCSSTSRQESPLKREESAEPDGTNKNTGRRSILSRNEIFIAREQDSCRRKTNDRGQRGRMKGKINQTAYQAASLIVVEIDHRLYIPGPLARI